MTLINKIQYSLKSTASVLSMFPYGVWVTIVPTYGVRCVVLWNTQFVSAADEDVDV
jgi:hypothetical protein